MNRKDEMNLRELLVEYGNKLLEEGLVQGTWGNLSVRLDETYMLCTPSGLDYERLTPADMVLVECSTLEHIGPQKPTSEKGLHAGIYLLHPDAGAVIHTHSKYCCIFAAADMPLQVEDPQLAAEIGEILPIAKYGFAGTKALTKNTLKALGARPGCIMSHHGMICWGRDLPDAFDKCRKIEQAAKAYIDRRWEK